MIQKIVREMANQGSSTIVCPTTGGLELEKKIRCRTLFSLELLTHQGRFHLLNLVQQILETKNRVQLVQTPCKA